VAALLGDCRGDAPGSASRALSAQPLQRPTRKPLAKTVTKTVAKAVTQAEAHVSPPTKSTIGRVAAAHARNEPRLTIPHGLACRETKVLTSARKTRWPKGHGR